MDEIDASEEFAGFQGFLPVAALRADRLRAVPERPGVYLVLWPGWERPHFLPQSPAGPHKGRDPSLPVADLRKAWVRDASVLYLGKAGGSGRRATLRSRLRAYLAHGAGRCAGHSGGRAIWQIAGSDALLVAWRVEPSREPRAVERELLRWFEQRYGSRPFANRTS